MECARCGDPLAFSELRCTVCGGGTPPWRTCAIILICFSGGCGLAFAAIRLTDKLLPDRHTRTLQLVLLIVTLLALLIWRRRDSHRSHDHQLHIRNPRAEHE
jgi:hypothetical protein